MAEDEVNCQPCSATERTPYPQIFKKLAYLSYPLIFSELFQSLLPVVDIAFVGNLGKDDLAIAALATTWFNFVNVTMFGFMTAVDTFLAQSYGARQFESYGIWTGNSLIIVLIATVVVSGVMALCGPFMHLVVSDPELARGAGIFALRLIPGLYPYFLFKVLCKYLQTQYILAPSTWIGLLANGINAVFNWALIYKAGWGVAGSPWATNLTRTAEFVLIGIYMTTKRESLLEQTWPVLSCQNLSFEQVRPFLKIGLAGAAAFLARGGFFEATTIMSSFLGRASLGAHSIGLSINTFLFVSFPFAIGNAASILVGRSVGEGKARDAKRSCHVSLLFSYIVQLNVIAILFVLREKIARLFSSAEEVSSILSHLIPIMCIFLFCDASVATAGGIWRGVGRQWWLLRINLFASWIVALPTAYCLAFQTSLGIYGLWWGMSVGVAISAMICQYVLNVCIDWNRECYKATCRLSSLDASNRRSSNEPLLRGHIAQPMCNESEICN